MAPHPSYLYAQLPVFKYQTFDRETLTFMDHPIPPPPPRQMRYADDDDYADDDHKSTEAFDKSPEENEKSASPVEVIDILEILGEVSSECKSTLRLSPSSSSLLIVHSAFTVPTNRRSYLCGSFTAIFRPWAGRQG